MNAEQYLNEALGGNMNISTLKPLAWHEIMEGYARHKLAEAQAASTNSDLMQLLVRCRDHIDGVSGRSLKGDGLLNEINAVLAQQH